MRHATAGIPVVALLVACGLLGAHAQEQLGPRSSAAFDSLNRMADEVARDVERLRGWTFKRPVRRERVTQEDVRTYATGQMDRTLPQSRRRVLQAFLRTSGLIPPDCDLAAAALKVLDQQVAGYYDSPSGTLFLVERADPTPEFIQRAILAHELTHALDDQYLNIGAITEPDASRTEDTDIVLSSLGEGSATALMFHYLTAQTAAGKVNALEAGAYFARELQRAKALAEMPRYFNAMFGSYTLGAAFLGKGDLDQVMRLPDDRGIGENFRAAWTRPPRSSEQILHPEKYWDEARRDEPVVIDDHAVEGWLSRRGRQVIHRNTLGELLTALLTEPLDAGRDAGKLMSTAAWTNAGASGWGGDRFYLLASGATEADAVRDLEGLQGAWVTAWDTPIDRDEFLAGLSRGHEPAHALIKSGTRVAVVLLGFDPSERDALARRLPSSPLSMTKDGRPWQ